MKLIEIYIKMSDDELMERYSQSIDYSLDAIVVMNNEVKERELVVNNEIEELIEKKKKTISENYCNSSEKKLKKIYKNWEKLGHQELILLKEELKKRNIRDYNEISNSINNQNKQNRNIREDNYDNGRNKKNAYQLILFIYILWNLFRFFLMNNVHIKNTNEISCIVYTILLMFITKIILLDINYEKVDKKLIFQINPLKLLYLVIVEVLIRKSFVLISGTNLNLGVKLLLSLLLIIIFLRMIFAPVIIIEENTDIVKSIIKAFKITKNKMKHIIKPIIIYLISLISLLLVSSVFMYLVPFKSINFSVLLIELSSMSTLKNGNTITRLVYITANSLVIFGFSIFITRKYIKLYKNYYYIEETE